jgi:hypothetical protein
MTLRDQVESLLRTCIEEYGRQAKISLPTAGDVPLFGPTSELDSLGLVMVVTDFEARLNRTFATGIVLASEQAMSMSRSPFRSVGTLTEYAVELLRKAGKE